MQNVQNADIQRVMNLVDLYRTKVGKESETAKEAKAEQEYWTQETLDTMNEMDANGEDYGMGFGLYGEGPHTEEWINKLKANEQLLGHFYKEVAGSNAIQSALNSLLPDYYDNNIYNEEEEMFLKDHFKEMVDYIIQSPNNDLSLVNRNEGKDEFLIPNEILSLIAEQVDIPSECVIYNPASGFAQLTTLYKRNKCLCSGALGWTEVVAYVNGINAEFIYDETIPSNFDILLSFLPFGELDNEAIDKLCQSYKNMKDNGRIVLIMSMMNLVKTRNPYDMAKFWRPLIDGKEITKVIFLPDVMQRDSYCIIIAEKNCKHDKTIFLDASSCFVKGEKLKDEAFETYWNVFDCDAFYSIDRNGGRDPKTNEIKKIEIESSQIDVNILLPEYYLMKRPTDDDCPVPLSSLCNIVKEVKVKSLDFDLPISTPWIKDSDLSFLFKGYLKLEEVEIANCPNNPIYSEDMKADFDKFGKFIDDGFHYFMGGTAKGQRIHEYRNSFYFDGKEDVILVSLEDEGMKSTIVNKGQGAFVAMDVNFPDQFFAFHTKSGLSSLELLSLLKMPMVYNQISLLSRYGGLACHIDDILVPFDERITNSEVHRLKCEEIEYRQQKEKMISMRTDYINEVRMRKHDMRPHMKQLNSAKNLMQHYVDNMDTIDDVKRHLNHQLIRFRDALSHLSDLIEHLSDEEQFGETERFSITDYFQNLVSETNNNGYDIEYFMNSGAIENYLKVKVNEYFEHVKTLADAQDEEFKKRGYNFPMHWSYTMIAPLDFDRMVQNILENARKHGFTDSTRSDYKVWIILSVDEKRDMYVIDFKNNGTPLPEGMTKERYGIKGEKAGLNGGTGSGGYIVKSIVTHYGGDYDVFYNNENQLTTVRVYLPIATI